MKIEQEPKYDVNDDGRIINRATGVAIPDDEPVFIFRAKDSLAYWALLSYAQKLEAGPHSDAVYKRIYDFDKFRRFNRDRMKMPDTAQAATTESSDGN